MVAQPFTWNAAYGYEWDCFADTGLYHVGARAYDPRTARWLQRDPIDAGGGDPNLYRYAGNDPVNRADPSGLEALDDAAHFAAGGATVSQATLPSTFATGCATC